MTVSALYAGTIAHRRRAEAEYGFRHRIVLAYLDLDELHGLLGGRLIARRPGAIRFRREDYLGDPAVPLADAVRALVRERTGDAPDGPVRLLTNLRVAGRCLNPVSFYYCHDADGTLRTIVAEVTNTPWRDRHAYVLDGTRRGSFDKELHVSPFFGMDQRYTWEAGEPGETLSVHIANHEADRRVFDAVLALRRQPLCRRGLLRHAGSAVRVGLLIYSHAVALKLKGVSIHPRPVPTP